MISQKKFLDIVYEAATCFIQTEELNNEQLESLDNIQYRLCDCQLCKKALDSGEDISGIGHAHKYRREVRISRVWLKFFLIENSFSIGLLSLIKIILHEIGHILYPDFAEMDIEDKVMEWFNSFDWNELKNIPSDWGKKYKEPIHSRKDILISRLEDAENVLDFYQGLMDKNPERREDESLIRIISEAERARGMLSPNFKA
jgi:hypothetical protein